jgi:molybdopterin converting factor subunit 1
MQIQILLFASVREAAGSSRISVSLEDGARASAVIDELGRRLPDRHALLERCAIAINEEYASPAAQLTDGDIVAVIPPVSGGSWSGAGS